jgi:beta-glucanase (GH16 family)
MNIRSLFNNRGLFAVTMLAAATLCWRGAWGDSGPSSLGSPKAVLVKADSSAEPVRPFGDDPSLRDYKLKFSDDFDGDALNTDTWVYRTDSKALSTQLPANVSVSGGFLHLALKKEDANKKHYTGGGIISKKEFTYGYYECRFKIPPGRGWHTSFWTMNHDGNGGTGTKVAAQEIDICEQDSGNHHKYSAGVIAWGNHGAGHGRKYIHEDTDLSEDFHVWGAEFTPTAVRFFFDGKMTHETDATTFKQGPQNIWLTSIAYPANESVDSAKLPSEATYDWVRFYEKP